MNWFKNFFGKVFSSEAKEEANAEVVLENDQLQEDLSQAVDEEYLLELEEKLLRMDCGIDFAEYICTEIRKKGDLTVGQAQQLLKNLCVNVLEEANPRTEDVQDNSSLQIILIVGVNGAGKTTSIGKLAHRFTQQGKKVLIAPCDTFRAAAEEQLQKWAMRAGAEFHSSHSGGTITKKADALLFEAIKKSVTEKFDILLVDTAGRLQSKKTLMEELSKLSQVITKHAPGEVQTQSLLVLDATTGQNGYQQAVAFNEVTKLAGIILTKFDGSAKGGIVFAIAHNLKLPIKFLGLGEKIDQLAKFKVEEFVSEVI